MTNQSKISCIIITFLLISLIHQMFAFRSQIGVVLSISAKLNIARVEEKQSRKTSVPPEDAINFLILLGETSFCDFIYRFTKQACSPCRRSGLESLLRYASC